MKLRLLECVARPTLRVVRLLGATSLALGLALGLPGCGPGTGGTGTGFPMNTAQPGNAQWFLGSWSSSHVWPQTARLPLRRSAFRRARRPVSPRRCGWT